MAYIEITSYPSINRDPIDRLQIKDNVKDCFNCHHLMTTYEQKQYILEQMKKRYKTRDSHYCKLQRDGEDCKWKKKRDK